MNHIQSIALGFLMLGVTDAYAVLGMGGTDKSEVEEPTKKIKLEKDSRESPSDFPAPITPKEQMIINVLSREPDKNRQISIILDLFENKEIKPDILRGAINASYKNGTLDYDLFIKNLEASGYLDSDYLPFDMLNKIMLSMNQSQVACFLSNADVAYNHCKKFPDKFAPRIIRAFHQVTLHKELTANPKDKLKIYAHWIEDLAQKNIEEKLKITILFDAFLRCDDDPLLLAEEIKKQLESEGAKKLLKAYKAKYHLVDMSETSQENFTYSNIAISKFKKEKIKEIFYNPQIHSIRINKDLTMEDIESIAESLRANTTILKLEFCLNKMDEDKAIKIIKALKTNTTLLSLAITNNLIGNKTASALAEILHSNTTLLSLDLTGNEIFEEGIKEIAESLKINTTMACLQLTNNHAGPNGAKALADMLETNHTLTSLNISDNQIGDEGAIAIATSLETNASLRKLLIWNNQIDIKGAQAFAKTLKANTTLSLLWMSYNKIGNKGTKAIAKALIKNKSLKGLWLSGNHIDYQGALELANSLEKNRSLQLLWICYNNIKDDGVMKILNTLQANPTLASLYLVHTSTTDKINGRLKEVFEKGSRFIKGRSGTIFYRAFEDMF